MIHYSKHGMALLRFFSSLLAELAWDSFDYFYPEVAFASMVDYRFSTMTWSHSLCILEGKHFCCLHIDFTENKRCASLYPRHTGRNLLIPAHGSAKDVVIRDHLVCFINTRHSSIVIFDYVWFLLFSLLLFVVSTISTAYILPIVRTSLLSFLFSNNYSISTSVHNLSFR